MPTDRSGNRNRRDEYKDLATQNRKELDRLEMEIVRSKDRVRRIVNKLSGIPASSVIDSAINELDSLADLLREIRAGQASGRFPRSRRAEHPPHGHFPHFQG